MPTSFLPVKPRTKSPLASCAADALSAWSASLGAIALMLAAFVYFSVGDAAGAAMTLASTAIVIAAMLYACQQSSSES